MSTRSAKQHLIKPLMAGIIVGLLATSAYGGSLNLQVHDSLTGQSIAGASIVCCVAIGDEDEVVHEALTSVHGLASFSLDLPTGVHETSTPAVRLQPQSFPNPSTGIASIHFQIPADKSLPRVTVCLFDLRGRRLSQSLLSDSVMPLPAQGYPAGIYLLQTRNMVSGEVSNTKITAGSRLHEIRYQLDRMEREWTKSVPPPIQLDISIQRPGYLPTTVIRSASAFPVEIEVFLERLVPPGTMNTWAFCTDMGWNLAAVDSGWLPAIADTATALDARFAQGDGTGFNLASLSSIEPELVHCSSSLVSGRGGGSPNNGVAVLPIVRFDLSALPEDITISEAWLIASPAPWSSFPTNGVSSYHEAIFNIWRDDECWLEAPPNTDCNTEAMWRQASWADSGSPMPWCPSLDQRSSWDDYGIRSERIHDTVEGGASCRYNVKRAIQFYCDHRDVAGNAGFILANSSSSRSYQVAAGPYAGSRQPVLLIQWHDQYHEKAWNGFPLAFAFGTDDGDTANVAYADICDSHEIPMTLYLMRRGIREIQDIHSPKLTADQCRHILARGHALGHHSDNHMPTWGLAELTWNAVDSLHHEVTRTTWMDSLFGEAGSDSLSEVTDLAYPNGGISLMAIKGLVNHDFLLGRGAGNGENWAYPPWGGVGPKTHLSWNDPVNLYALAITNHSLLVGPKEESPDLGRIRLMLRRQTGAMLNQGQAALITFCHSTKQSAYPGGIEPQELDLLLTAVQESGFYLVETLQDLVIRYRQHHVPINPAGSDFAITAYDSLIQAGHQEFQKVWWLPTD